MKKHSTQHLHALLSGAWTAQDEQGRWTVYAVNLDGEVEAIATGCPQGAYAGAATYINSEQSSHYSPEPK